MTGCTYTSGWARGRVSTQEESGHMRGRVGTATATGPAPSQVVPITAATTASPAAMAVAVRTAMAATAGMAMVVTVGRVSKKEVQCTWTRRWGLANANWGLKRQTASIHKQEGPQEGRQVYTNQGQVRRRFGAHEPGGEQERGAGVAFGQHLALPTSFSHFILSSPSPFKLTVVYTRICASGVPTGEWGIFLDPSLRFNTYSIFNYYLVIKILSGWFAVQSFFMSQITHPHQAPPIIVHIFINKII